jgi:hypothetical protein
MTEGLMGGHVSASVNPVSEIIEFSKSGTVRMLAVTGSQRFVVSSRHPDHAGSGIQRHLVGDGEQRWWPRKARVLAVLPLRGLCAPRDD